MLDLKFIRENTNLVRNAIKNKREKADLDALLQLDKKRRELIAEVESARAEQNKVTALIPEMKKRGKDASQVIAEMRALSDKIKKESDVLKSVESEIRDIQIRIPNIPHSSVPIGDESANEEVRRWGEIPKKDFKPKPHYEIAEKLEIIDFNRASRMSGSFFVGYR
ncbi:MAG: serine--tRNA ligase, partial [Calditrichaeota bacterium]|nr:serine--tRNA ligase [Calditrichota bacterium]